MTPDHDHYDPCDYDPDVPDLEVRVTPEANDPFVGAEVRLPLGGILREGRIASQKRDADGHPIGLSNDNWILDTRKYVVQFDDGNFTELTANKIAESVYSQCDPDGYEYYFFDAIIIHRRLSSAIALKDQTRIQPSGRAFKTCSTVGWQLCCQWKDGSTSLIDLKDLKESHPIQTAEYAKTAGIDHEPAFNWWTNDVLRRREQIIYLVRKRETRYLKRTHKYGIKVPKTVKQAYELDCINGNTLWADAIAKEMKNVRVAFSILPKGETAPGGYKKI